MLTKDQVLISLDFTQIAKSFKPSDDLFFYIQKNFNYIAILNIIGVVIVIKFLSRRYTFRRVNTQNSNTDNINIEINNIMQEITRRTNLPIQNNVNIINNNVNNNTNIDQVLNEERNTVINNLFQTFDTRYINNPNNPN